MLPELVLGALGVGQGLVEQTGVTLRRRPVTVYDPVAGRPLPATPAPVDTYCATAVVVPFGGSYADRLVDASKLKTHSRRCLLSWLEAGETPPDPDDVIITSDGQEWAVVSGGSIGGLHNLVITR